MDHDESDYIEICYEKLRNEGTISTTSTLSRKIILILSWFLCFLLFSLGTLGTICPGEIEFSEQNFTCKFLMNSVFHGDWMRVTTWFITTPIFVASVALRFINGSINFQSGYKENIWVTRGSPNVKIWCFILTVCPAVYIIIDALVNYGREYDESYFLKKGTNSNASVIQ